jgi:hypothetical protein
MRIGVGGGAFGVRGGISNRGIGIGAGPLSAGTAWRRRGSGGGGLLAWLFVGAILFLMVAWPYLLGSWIAVQLGAGNPSATRTAVGWMFEIAYIVGLIAWFILTRENRAQGAAEQSQRHAELVASGAVYTTRSGRSVAYRHGLCTVNHRSHGTAARCNKG